MGKKERIESSNLLEDIGATTARSIVENFGDQPMQLCLIFEEVWDPELEVLKLVFSFTKHTDNAPA